MKQKLLIVLFLFATLFLSLHARWEWVEDEVQEAKQQQHPETLGTNVQQFNPYEDPTQTSLLNTCVALTGVKRPLALKTEATCGGRNTFYFGSPLGVPMRKCFPPCYHSNTVPQMNYDTTTMRASIICGAYCPAPLEYGTYNCYRPSYANFIKPCAPKYSAWSWFECGADIPPGSVNLGGRYCSKLYDNEPKAEADASCSPGWFAFDSYCFSPCPKGTVPFEDQCVLECHGDTPYRVPETNGAVLCSRSSQEANIMHFQHWPMTTQQRRALKPCPVQKKFADIVRGYETFNVVPQRLYL